MPAQNVSIDKNVYIRKLNAQELGYRKGAPKQAGRYIFISKKCLVYFPPLSTVIKNDHIILEVIPPKMNKAVLTSYIYHNDKIVDDKPNGRDEFRLYLNDELDPGGKFFNPDDIVILSKCFTDENIFYRMYYFPSAAKSKEYRLIEKILAAGEVPGSHAIAPISSMPFMNFKGKVEVSNKIVPKEVVENAFKDPVKAPVEEAEEREEVSRLIRSASFRDLVLFFYDKKCAITRRSICYGDLTNLEAAHIIPRQYGGKDNPKNGIALNRDMHWAFDKGLFTIKKNYKIEVHPKVKGSVILDEIDNKEIFLPEDSRARPDEMVLGWHKSNIYGIFLKTF